MAENSTIARPYSQAAFDFAKDNKKLGEWSEMIQTASAVVSDPQIQAMIGNTNIDQDRLAGLVIDCCAKVDDGFKNFIKLLVSNRRLNVTPEIAQQFEILRAEAENTIEAELRSASKVTAAQEKSIVTALEKRLGRKVQLNTRVDESLIGGAILRAGDLVIDGSAVGRLAHLKFAIS